MTHQQDIELATAGHGDMHDLTDDVERIVAESAVERGTVHVFNVGSTAAIGCVEFEPGLERDLPEQLNRLLPPSRSYGHEQTWHDGNGHSHLQASLLGFSTTLPVAGGRLVRGTWQQVFHLECDVKPRNRRVVVTVHGDAES